MVICARKHSPTGLAGTLEETAMEIRNVGGDVFAIDCDVTDESQVNEMVRQAIERCGRIDVLFNDAGAMVLGESPLESVKVPPPLMPILYKWEPLGGLRGKYDALAVSAGLTQFQ